MKVDTRHVKYVFADVVSFSIGRTVEAQVEIIAVLNKAFQDGIGSLETIFLPTGDGLCAGIIEPNAPMDAHLKVALRVLELVEAWNIDAKANRQFKIRFGL